MNTKMIILAALAVAFTPAVVSILEMDTDVNAGPRYAVETRTVESGAIAVDSDTSVTEYAGTITVPMTTIVAHTARTMAGKVKGCDFASRALVQGRGNVRGFCL